MIDTTKWVIDTTKEQWRIFQTLSKELILYDHNNKQTEFQVLKSDREIGSFNNKIIIRVYEKERIELEFSIPKYYLGNNIELVYPQQIEDSLISVNNDLINEFGEFPSYKKWELQRLDLCYAWKYKDQESAQNILNALKTFDYPRKNKFVYDTSVMWRGRTYSLKFYLKQNEFFTNDYHKLFNKITSHGDNKYKDLALELHEFSSGVLRFEISIRKQALSSWFKKKHIYFQDITNYQKIEEILQSKLKNIIQNLDKNVSWDREIIKKLEVSYSKRKAIRLFQFYKIYNSTQTHNRQILKEKYNYSTLWRNRKDIASAQIGIPHIKKNIEFNLDIPSDLVVNWPPLDPSESGSLGGISNTA